MSQASASSERVRDVAQTAIFLLALVLPAIGLLAGINDDAKLAENRLLHEAPVWPGPGAGADAWTGLPRDFEAWFDDHFGFRSLLIERDKRLEWLAARSEVGVSVGRDGWLFLGHDREVAGYRCVAPDGPVLESWRELARRRRELVAASNARLLWVVAPNKHTVYPEFLKGDEVSGAGRPCRLDVLRRELAEPFDLAFLDLRPAFRQARGEVLLYHRTDTHWNQLGALIASEILIDRVREETRAPIPPLQTSGARLRTFQNDWAGNLAARLMVYGEDHREPFRALAEPRPLRARQVGGGAPLDLRMHARPERELRFATGDPRLPRAVVFHDSFAFAMMPILADAFDEVVFVNTGGILDLEVLEREAPDLVISLMVEAKLTTPAPPELGPSRRARAPDDAPIGLASRGPGGGLR